MTDAPFAPLEFRSEWLPSAEQIDEFTFPRLSSQVEDVVRFDRRRTEMRVSAADPLWPGPQGVNLWWGRSEKPSASVTLPADVRYVVDAFNENPRASWLALFAHHAAAHVAETKAAYEDAKALNSAIWFHPDRKRDITAEQSFRDLIGVPREAV
ncbi:hypothetical protein [Microbacterium sp. 77mftsu3.1]|uniref:hypothetical protein n=1 Tax=Microbacterium sp. 77mftsu3.1 TaxID=1761802 RepID=UPI000370937B|nr:hypothetical protein [Microbacterium sp. 77mftsu3.1]SDH42670.1 hypothetical protein SAMN04488590_3313 [Microbacterium sp. 77mftsu3.1]